MAGAAHQWFAVQFRKPVDPSVDFVERYGHKIVGKPGRNFVDYENGVEAVVCRERCREAQIGVAVEPFVAGCDRMAGEHRRCRCHGRNLNVGVIQQKSQKPARCRSVGGGYGGTYHFEEG